MAYQNPGAVAAEGFSNFLLSREDRQHKMKMDDLKMQQEQLELEKARVDATNAAIDRQRADFTRETSTMVPGDVPDADLLERSKKLGMPLPIKVIKGAEAQPIAAEGPVQAGEEPLPMTELPATPDKSVYIGTPAQQATERTLKSRMAAAQQTDPNQIMQTILAAGGDPKEAKEIIDALQTGVPVYRSDTKRRVIEEFVNGQWQPATSIKEKGHWLQEPNPTTVNVNGAGGAGGESEAWKVDNYIQTGQYPAMGSGNSAAVRRDKFDKAVTARLAELNLNGADIARNASRYKATQGALTNLTRTYESTEAFSESAQQNLKNLREVMKRIPDHDIGVLNYLHRGLERATGNEDMSEFDTYRRSVANEFARIISQANGGVLTDSARHEVDELVKPNASVGQINASLKALETEAGNRSNAYQDRINGLANQAGPTDGPGPGAAQPAQPARKQIRYDSQGNPVK